MFGSWEAIGMGMGVASCRRGEKTNKEIFFLLRDLKGYRRLQKGLARIFAFQKMFLFFFSNWLNGHHHQQHL